MAHLTIAEVEHIALLARLYLSDEEKERYAHQLSAILNYAAELDAPCYSLPREDAFKNAPQTDGTSFEVQAALP